MDTASVTDRDMISALLGAAASIEHRLDGGLSSIKGISYREFALLHALHHSPGSSATRVALAEAVGRTPSGVTRALQPLEKLGFVQTTKDARDARRSLASLTPQGVELLTDAEGVVEDSLGSVDALGAIDNDQRSQLIEVLRSLG